MPSRTGLEHTEIHNLTITPNPVKPQELLTIDCSLTGADNNGLTIELVGTTGMVVYHQTIENLPFNIPAPSQSGLYIIRITNETGQVFRDKLLVE